jgi:hypothetical protein
MPVLRWRHSKAPEGRLRLEIESTPRPRSARLWVAKAPTRDFREARWNATVVPVEAPVIVAEAERPASGYIALLGDLEYEIDTIKYHLSTQLRQSSAEPED